MPCDREILHQQDIGGDLRHLAAGEADDQQPAAPVGGAQRHVEALAAHRVIDHIGAAAIGDLAHAGAQMFSV